MAGARRSSREPGKSDPIAGATMPRWFAALHPLLFAAYAVLFLWTQNLGEADPRQVLVPLLVVVAGAGLLTLILGLILRERRRAAIVATPIVVGLTMYGHAVNVARPLGVPAIAHQVAWTILVLAALVVALRSPDRWIDALDTALDRIGALLVIVTLVVIVPFEVQSLTSRASVERATMPPATTTAAKRDVYWLVFDRYGSDRSLELAYDIDNDLTPWLVDQGFDVLADSHANYIRTVLSMSTTVQMSHLERIAASQGAASRDLAPVIEGLQDPPVARQFKALGYRYLHVGVHHDPTRADRGADVNLNVSLSPVDFVEALYDASAGPAIARRLRLEGGDVARERQFRYNTYGLDAVEGLRDEPGPKFVMGHILLPHPPMVFDRDGSFMDAADTAAMPFIEQYQRQLDFTNRRIREIVSGLLALPEDRRPIIILQADEGPFPGSYGRQRRSSTDWAAGASGDDLEIKFGILNAWYLPGGEDLGLDPSMTAINTFPTLFTRYFGLDYELLPDRVYSSHDWFRPYDLTDVTDRLPSIR
jgi:hypothetical protein